ncbi:MAG TPA: DUF4153 domain-containing protein, partial [Tissierellaceae bacterium]|nr:DUF4153 domain-containing protein [Tissierellaceae bacterium]
MKIKNRLFDIWQSLKESSQRFPITVGMSLLLFILLIYYNENLENLSNLQQDRFIRFNMIIGLGIGLSLVISLIGERFFPKDKTRKILAHMGGTIGLIFYYKYFLREVRGVTIIRYFGVLILLWILFFYIPRYKVKESYEKYVIKIFANFFVTLIYSLVLLFGIFIILFTVDSLFDVNIKGKYYYYVYLFVSLVFSIALFLSKLPEADERFFDYNYSNSLRVLLTYIIIPLISIYTIILYLYFA